MYKTKFYGESNSRLVFYYTPATRTMPDTTEKWAIESVFFESTDPVELFFERCSYLRIAI